MNNSSYPHHHSLSNSHELIGRALRPVCAYCLHWISTDEAGEPLSDRLRRGTDDAHHCVEKLMARQPQAALPFN